MLSSPELGGAKAANCAAAAIEVIAQPDLHIYIDHLHINRKGTYIHAQTQSWTPSQAYARANAGSRVAGLEGNRGNKAIEGST